MRKRTRLSVIGLAVVATMAVAAQGASAFTWTNAGKEFKSGEEQALKAAAVVDKFVNGKGEEEAIPRLIFTGNFLTAPVKITSTSVETSVAVIKQNGTVANFIGKLVFKGLTLDEPAGCSPPTSVTTNALTGTVAEIGGLTYVKLTPTAGTTTPFATVTLTGTCAIAGRRSKSPPPRTSAGGPNRLGRWRSRRN